MSKDFVSAAANQRRLSGKADPTQISAQGQSGETRDILAKLAGVSHDTLTKVENLERDADDELKAKLRAGNISVNKAWTQLNQRKKKAEIPFTVSSVSDNEQISEQSESITNTSVTYPSSLFSGRRQRDPFFAFLDKALDTSDVEDSLAVISDQPSYVSELSLPDDLNPFLMERWRFIASIFENKPVYSSSDDLDKEWSGDFILFSLPGLESDFKSKLEESASLGNVGYVLAVEPFIVDSLRSFLEVAEFSFTYEDHGTIYQVLVFKGSDIA